MRCKKANCSCNSREGTLPPAQPGSYRYGLQISRDANAVSNQYAPQMRSLRQDQLLKLAAVAMYCVFEAEQRIEGYVSCMCDTGVCSCSVYSSAQGVYARGAAWAVKFASLCTPAKLSLALLLHFANGVLAATRWSLERVATKASETPTAKAPPEGSAVGLGVLGVVCDFLCAHPGLVAIEPGDGGVVEAFASTALSDFRGGVMAVLHHRNGVHDQAACSGRRMLPEEVELRGFLPVDNGMTNGGDDAPYSCLVVPSGDAAAALDAAAAMSARMGKLRRFSQSLLSASGATASTSSCGAVLQPISAGDEFSVCAASPGSRSSPAPALVAAKNGHAPPDVACLSWRQDVARVAFGGLRADSALRSYMRLMLS